ncbi:hypothetical protein P609_11015 [Comamonas thiooxydans]|nr:hypothetical protein P609_11015 [Comamonas thiooxydans]
MKPPIEPAFELFQLACLYRVAVLRTLQLGDITRLTECRQPHAGVTSCFLFREDGTCRTSVWSRWADLQGMAAKPHGYWIWAESEGTT